MNTYDVNYFINKFEAIPESKIINNDQGKDGFHCAVGHCKNIEGGYGFCTPNKKDDPHYSPEANALMNLFLNAGIDSKTNPGTGWCIADVNNGDHPKYPQPTPKQRILAALHDIKKLQERAQPAIKEKIKYVSVPASITEQTKELVLS